MDLRELRDRDDGVFGLRVGFGEKPVVLIVDLLRAYTDPVSPMYVAESENVVLAVIRVLDAARSGDIPIIYTRMRLHRSLREGGAFLRKCPILSRMVEGERLAELTDEVRPFDRELLLDKAYPSAFFGTSLLPFLISERADTLVVCGFSTSGCIRATALDGLQYGFHIILPKECVGDRHQILHEVNLFDIDSKYGDVVSIEDVLPRLRPTDLAAQ